MAHSEYLFRMLRLPSFVPSVRRRFYEFSPIVEIWEAFFLVLFYKRQTKSIKYEKNLVFLIIYILIHFIV